MTATDTKKIETASAGTSLPQSVQDAGAAAYRWSEKAAKETGSWLEKNTDTSKTKVGEWGESFRKSVKDLSGWDALGMGGAGIIGWMIGQVFGGGGLLGNALGAMLGFGLAGWMGRDFGNTLRSAFGSDSSRPSQGDGRGHSRVQEPQRGRSGRILWPQSGAVDPATLRDTQPYLPPDIQSQARQAAYSAGAYETVTEAPPPRQPTIRQRNF